MIIKGVPLSFMSSSIGYLEHYTIKNLKEKVESLKDRNIKCKLRMAVNKAGPVITDDGSMLYDVDFDGILDCDDVEKIDNVLQMIPGVVETGLFVNMAEMAYYGQIDGSVIKQTKDKIITVKPTSAKDTDEQKDDK